MTTNCKISHIPTSSSSPPLQEYGFLGDSKLFAIPLKKSASDISFMSHNIVLFPDVDHTFVDEKKTKSIYNEPKLQSNLPKRGKSVSNVDSLVNTQKLNENSEDSSSSNGGASSHEIEVPATSTKSSEDYFQRLNKNIEDFLRRQQEVQITRKRAIGSRIKFTPEKYFEVTFPQVGKGLTQGKASLTWFLLGLRGDFKMSVCVNGLKLISMHRHVKLGLTETTTVRSGKVYFGKIKQKMLVNLGIRKLYKIYDHTGRHILNVFSPMLHPRTFYAQEVPNGEVKAKIFKYWDLTNIDSQSFKKLEMKFFENTTVPQKALLLATVFLVSMSHI